MAYNDRARNTSLPGAGNVTPFNVDQQQQWNNPDMHKGATTLQFNQMSALNPMQVQLQNQMLRSFMAGNGDFGFGQAAKQGQDTLASIMASRGISPTSPAYSGALAQVMAQAAAADTQNRRNYGMGLLQATPAHYQSLTRQLARGEKQEGGGLGGLMGTGLGILGGNYLGALGQKWGEG